MPTAGWWPKPGWSTALAAATRLGRAGRRARLVGRAWWRSAAGSVDGRGARVRAVGVSGLGPCLVPADADGRPLRPAILYGIDSRAEEEIGGSTEELGADAILARGGSLLSSQSVGTEAPLARRATSPRCGRRTRRVFGASSYVVRRLTGEYVLDHHSASHWAPLYDVHAQRVDRRVGEQVAPGLALPRLVWPQERPRDA